MSQRIKEIEKIGHVHEKEGREITEGVTNGRLHMSHRLRIYQVHLLTTDGQEGVGTVSHIGDPIVVITADFN